MEAVLEDMAVPDQIRDRSANSPARIPENIRSYERLLNHNRKAAVIWEHAGWDNTGAAHAPAAQRSPKPFLGLKMSPLSVFKENDPIQRGAGLRPEWRALIADYPDRFLLGSDYFAARARFHQAQTLKSPARAPNH